MRHVCGTCRFFQAAEPNAKSGWCGHPLKQTTTDVRILVRAGELNCRNDWDKDLWQLREVGDRVLDVSMVKPADQGTPKGRPMRTDAPRTLGQDTPRTPAPDAPRLDQPLPPPDDILIGEDLDAPRLVSEDLNRELLRRAREQYRARRLSTRPDGPSPRLSDGPAPTIHRSEPIVISNDVQPLQIGMEPGPDLTRVSGRERWSSDEEPDEEPTPGRFSSVPEIDQAIEPPRRSTRRPAERPVVDDFEMEALDDRDDLVVPRRPKNSGPSRSDRGSRWSREVDVDAPDVPAIDARRTFPEETRETVEDPHAERSTDRSQSASQVDVVRPVDPDDIRPWDYVEPRRSRPGDLDARDIGRMNPPSPSRLWDDIPRCCRTCRDFRPAETGGRGWCTNRWAFRHRRMVDIDELPCETTIGAWWLPTDDAWQDDLDVGRHTLSTPLMDKWFGRIDDEPDAHYPAVATRTRRRS